MPHREQSSEQAAQNLYGLIEHIRYRAAFTAQRRNRKIIGSYKNTGVLTQVS